MNGEQSVTQLVTIGASAGGVETLATLVATLPAAFPAPIVVAQHLDPTRPSHLQEILGRRCPLPVRTVTDRAPLEAGVLYVVPANRHIVISDHHLSIEDEDRGRPKPSIDLLFRTAAQVFGEGLIAVVLSGLGSDGAAGARRVKEAGGTVVIQNPRTAPFPAMPKALAPSMVDVVADADIMGPLLYDLLTGAYIPAGPQDDRQLRAFLAEVRDSSGVDFSLCWPFGTSELADGQRSRLNWRDSVSCAASRAQGPAFCLLRFSMASVTSAAASPLPSVVTC